MTAIRAQGQRQGVWLGVAKCSDAAPPAPTTLKEVTQRRGGDLKKLWQKCPNGVGVQGYYHHRCT